MSHLRPRRKLLTIAASGAATTALVLAGCSSNAVGSSCEPACLGEPAVSLDGGDVDGGDASAPDASDAATDGPVKVDAGVIAPPLDGGDGG